MKKIKITDAFWNKRISLVGDVIVPYQWEALNDRVEGAEKSGCVSNFMIAAGLKEGDFYGHVFQDSDLAKWIEAAAYVVKNSDPPDAELIEKIDYIVSLIEGAQWEDGYINTCTTLTGKHMRWKNLLERHELYIAGHLIEAAVAYQEAAGNDKFLSVMRKFADLICDTFGYGENRIPGYPGHQEIELALVKLYRATGEKKYLDTAKYFIDARGVGENYFETEVQKPDFARAWSGRVEPAYNQSHLPVCEQTTAEGHSVRALYMYAAMAELTILTGDKTLAAACETLWENITQKRMYITGAVGSSGNGERFTNDYDLPNDAAYAESCASIALVFFGDRMNKLTNDAKYIDAAEAALYNTVLAGMAADGRSFFYVNPLEVVPGNCGPGSSISHVKTERQKWFGCACCPPNITRLLASLDQYVYFYENETLYVNFFIANEAEFDGIKIEMAAGFPETDGFNLDIETDKVFKLALRIPEYAEDYRVELNREIIKFETKKGYALVNINGGAKIGVSFNAPARFVYSNPAVSRNNGLAAVKKGPLVYCFEEADNGRGTASFFAETDAPPEAEWDDCLGVWKIKIRGKYFDGWNGGLYSNEKPTSRAGKIIGIPYALWNNRGAGEMFVWVKRSV